MCSIVTQLKKQEEYSWLKEVNSQSLNVSIYNLEKAYTGFFRDKKGYPKFKSKYSQQVFACPQFVTVDFENKHVYLPKFKTPIYCEFSRYFEGKIKTCTIKKTKTNKYFISILVDDGLKEIEKPTITKESAIGIDLGLKDFAILSNGNKIENLKFYRNQEQKLKILQKRASKKQKGSKNRQKANLKIALLHEKIHNQRKDFIYKTIRYLFDKNQANTFCLENLNTSGMMKNHKLAKSIQDVSWSMFNQILEGKCNLEGKNILRIGRFEPSSKTCSTCGYIMDKMTLDIREWECPKCHVKHDRDINAAKNIKQIALYKKFSGLGQPEVPVEMLELSKSMKQESDCFSYR
jgi:putative transposase